MKLKDLVAEYGEWGAKENFLDFLERPKQTIWDLEEGDTYWWVDGQVRFSFWNGYRSDVIRQESGNCFLTKEEAEKELKRQKVEALLKKYVDGYEWTYNEFNYHLTYYKHEFSSGILIVHNSIQKQAGVIYFPTREAAEKAIEEIGEERIIRDYFQIEYPKEGEE